MTSRHRLAEALAIGAALAIGVAWWSITMAWAPRHSPTNMGEPGLYFGGLTIAAAATGLAVPRAGPVVAALLGVPGLVLSPWTAPRGDDDGLWILIVPVLFVFAFVLATVAAGTAWLSGRSSRGAG